MIQLIVEPKTPPIPWEEFVKKAPSRSIALDGYISGGPRYDDEHKILNLNHHEDVDRLATRATCGQVLMAIRQGLFQVFRHDEGPVATVYVNDCDEDVATAWYLLKHHAVCEQAMNPLLNRLVMMEDALDATAGAYPFPADLPVLRELAWVFEPYRRFRLSGGLDRKDAGAYRCVIEDVESRIARHVTGGGGEQALDTRYERLGGGHGWAMVRESGAQARTGMFSDGIRAYVSVRERPDGTFTYVVGRMSQFIPFNLRRIFERCNVAEDSFHNEENKRLPGDLWGGGDTIGGSPRVEGSRINPDNLAHLIETSR
jgi:hypothetical protein